MVSKSDNETFLKMVKLTGKPKSMSCHKKWCKQETETYTFINSTVPKSIELCLCDSLMIEARINLKGV